MLGGEVQLLEGAEHAVGGHATELALFNLCTAGEQGFVLGNRHQVAHMDVPCAGDDLGRLRLSHVDLADPHVVAVRVFLHGENLAHHHIFRDSFSAVTVSTLEPERVMASSNSRSLMSETSTNSFNHLRERIIVYPPLLFRRESGIPSPVRSAH